ncbi:hypothetical protein J3Q64DRAFT_1007722 [Phycomyces blakesleeanus]|uniref:Uncharacterized protein n=1 Tax=Phycomyces blakesleeanus TaxID=4837 RepID=A0ABR3BB74_PHYBL
MSSKGKKRRISNAKLGGIGVDASQSTIMDDTPASPNSNSNSNSAIDSEPIPVLMDELVDTSQLYTRSSSRSPSPDPEINSQFSRDLSRWQRVPIGAFRLMRAKNKFWLDR